MMQTIVTKVVRPPSIYLFNGGLILGEFKVAIDQLSPAEIGGGSNRLNTRSCWACFPTPETPLTPLRASSESSESCAANAVARVRGRSVNRQSRSWRHLHRNWQNKRERGGPRRFPPSTWGLAHTRCRSRSLQDQKRQASCRRREWRALPHARWDHSWK